MSTTTAPPSPSPSPFRVPVTYVSESSPVVIINYSDLDAANDLSDVIEAAYGYKGLGIMVIRGVPEFVEKRANLLPLAHKFATLSAETKAAYEDEASSYGVGWSHGKENLDGKPDWRKGSYYANPLFDEPSDDPEKMKRYPYFFAPNIWPREHLPELEPAFKALGALVINTGLKLAKHTDRYIQSKVSTYQTDKLHNIIRTCKIAKARLLHYFPCDEPIPGQENVHVTKTEEKSSPADADFASWCGWHNDHGSLTGLTSAMYIDNKTGLECSSPSPDNGLYIRSRQGQVVRAVIPVDCLAFQMGESQQIHSGGCVQATPHCVHATSDPTVGAGISRETFALFMEPMPDEEMNVPEGCDPEKAREGTSTKYLPPGVPALGVRWTEKDDFGKFTERSINAYTVRM